MIKFNKTITFKEAYGKDMPTFRDMENNFKMTMIKRVARALCDIEQGERTMDECIIAAKAAILAMREPTEEMLKNVAVINYNFPPMNMLDHYNRDKDLGRLTYQFMIDAALKE